MRFPEHFSSHNEPNGSVEYRQAPELYAVHGLVPAEHPQGELVRVDDRVAICQRAAAPPEQAGSQKTTPVYRVGENGPVGAPTGALFVRLDDDFRLNDLEPQLAELGFKVARTSPGKGNAGWITPRSGLVEESLQRIADISSLQGVTVVEPEMLMVRHKKSML